MTDQPVISDGYVRRARMVRVYDGDTVRLDIDLGWGMTFNNQPVRLAGIDTPEIRTRDAEEKRRGYEAKAFVVTWMAEAEDLDPEWPLRLHSLKREKYGRVLGHIYRLDGRELSADLQAGGFSAS